MSLCDPSRVDAFVNGELPVLERASMDAHLERCPACGTEARALRGEAETFAARAREPYLALPAFSAVMDAVDTPRALNPRRAVPAVFAAVASLAAALLLTMHAPVRTGEVAASGGACFLGDGEGATVELAEASEESRFNECLLASPALADRCF